MMGTLDLPRVVMPAVLVAGALLSCKPGNDEGAPSTTRLAPFASVADAPLTDVSDVVLLASGHVCVTDGEQYRVSCTTPSGPWNSFGAKGDGPGEFRSVIKLARVAGQPRSLAVADWASQRLSIFNVGGEFEQAVRLPPAFSPLSAVGARTIWGLYVGYERGPMRGHVAAVSLADGSLAEDAKLHRETEDDPNDKVARFVRAVMLPDSSVFAYDTDHRFAVFTRTGARIREIEYPPSLSRPVYPTAAEAGRYTADITSLLGRPPSPGEMREYRHTPLAAVLKGAGIRTGPGGEVWVPSVRTGRGVSYLDVFGMDGYRRTVSVPGRMLNFDILGDTLVALTAAMDDDMRRSVQFFRLGARP